MNNNLIKEIKFRCFFVCLNWFVLTNIFYFYKEILLFQIFKNLNYLSNLEFYLVYTNITELFTIFIKLVNFCSLQITFIFMIYHVLVFCIPTFYNKEYKLIIVIFFIILFSNSFYYIFFLKLCNLLIEFLKNFQEPYIFFEVKINEILQFLFQLFFRFQVLFVSLMLLFFIQIKKNNRFMRKISYFLFIFISIYHYLNNSIENIFLGFGCLVIFEFIFFLFLLKRKTLRIK